MVHLALRGGTFLYLYGVRPPDDLPDATQWDFMEYGSPHGTPCLHLWASSGVWHSRGNSRVPVGLIHIFPGIPVLSGLIRRGIPVGGQVAPSWASSTLAAFPRNSPVVSPVL